MSKNNTRTIEVGVKPQERELIRRAAKQGGYSMSAFVRDAAIRRAEFIVRTFVVEADARRENGE